MSIKLEDYQELLDGLPPEAVQVLHSSWVEATKSFSARGLDNYLKAASAINQLGKGAALVIAWLEEAPHVSKEIGEEVIVDLAQTAMNLTSKTSGSVIELILTTSTNRSTPSGRCAPVPELSAIHRYPDFARAARRAADAGQAGCAAGPADIGRVASLGDVGGACASHQLRRAGQLFRTEVERVSGDTAERAQRHAVRWMCSVASTRTFAPCGAAIFSPSHLG